MWLCGAVGTRTYSPFHFAQLLPTTRSARLIRPCGFRRCTVTDGVSTVLYVYSTFSFSSDGGRMWPFSRYV